MLPAQPQVRKHPRPVQLVTVSFPLPRKPYNSATTAITLSYLSQWYVPSSWSSFSRLSSGAVASFAGSGEIQLLDLVPVSMLYGPALETARLTPITRRRLEVASPVMEPLVLDRPAMEAPDKALPDRMQPDKAQTHEAHLDRAPDRALGPGQRQLEPLA